MPSFRWVLSPSGDRSSQAVGSACRCIVSVDCWVILSLYVLWFSLLVPIVLVRVVVTIILLLGILLSRSSYFVGFRSHSPFCLSALHPSIRPLLSVSRSSLSDLLDIGLEFFSTVYDLLFEPAVSLSTGLPISLN